MLGIFKKKKRREDYNQQQFEENLKAAVNTHLQNPKVNKRAKIGFYIVIGMIVILFLIRQI